MAIQKEMVKKVIILGSTGSIGKSTLDVIRKNRDFFKVIALSCNKNVNLLVKQANEFKPEAIAVLKNVDDKSKLNNISPKVYKGEDGLLMMIGDLKADIVVNGISGASGLLPSLVAIESGKNLALANKETIVMAGSIILSKAEEKGVEIIPVDSEHSALFQLLQLIKPDRVGELIITASGGPFLSLSKDQLSKVTPGDALKHPTWNMGKKITIDSATMGNKGLEVIEAHYLFNMPVSKIKVVIHPQSLIHSLVQTVDGCLMAQISKPDMRMPIHYALFFPETYPADFSRLDLAGKQMTFLPVDQNKYEMLKLAYSAASEGNVLPIVYNASNEIAVDAFLKKRISFVKIPEIVEYTLDKVWVNLVASIDEILYIDKEARRIAQEKI